MRKAIALVFAIAALLVTPTAIADPDFGPGNSTAGPHDANAHCHPPGQTADLPQCK